jgi:TatD DNase family protein
MEHRKKIEYIDVHTHVNLEAFKDDFYEVGEHTHAEGVAYINVGTGKETSARAVELVSDGVFATVGLHPVRAGGQIDDDGTPPEVFDLSYYETLARREGIVAIGECGFDFYRVEKDTKVRQEEAFIRSCKQAWKTTHAPYSRREGEYECVRGCACCFKKTCEGFGERTFFCRHL